ncbi:MAG: hypothetical protein HGB11_09530 [Chlorobiales bacterium]|nr:hypothetical protein [Chlorobiales bacterium]
MIGPKAQRIAREFWRILEVYLFFVVSILGCTGFSKVPSSFNAKSKDRSSDRKLEQRLSFKAAPGEIVSPYQLVWLTNFNSGKVDLVQKQFRGTFNSPLILPLEYYRSNPLLSVPALSSPEGMAIGLQQVQTPLLI